MVDVILIIIFLILGIGIISLQLYLSKRENKWWGLMLPVVTFLVSTIVVIGIVMITIYNVEVLAAIEEGLIAGQATLPALDNPDVVMTGVMAFIMFNLPTMILLIIYVVMRNKIKQEATLTEISTQEA